MKNCSLRIMWQIASVVLLTMVMLTLLSRWQSHTPYHDMQKQRQFIEEFNVAPLTGINFLSQVDFSKQVEVASHFGRMNDADLKARSTKDTKVTSTVFYRTYYTNSFTNFTDDDKMVIIGAVSKANAKLAAYTNLRETPWNFVKVTANIENNFPHTIGNMIIVNDIVLASPELVKTLIHEKIHVFQRLNNLSTRQLITSLNYASLTPDERAALPEDVRVRSRANPDLDGHVYIHKPTRTVIAQVYNSDIPSSIADSAVAGYNANDYYRRVSVTNELLGIPSNLKCQLEHPFEIIACIAAELLMVPELAEKEKQNLYIDEIMKWMSTHMKA